MKTVNFSLFFFWRKWRKIFFFLYFLKSRKLKKYDATAVRTQMNQVINTWPIRKKKELLDFFLWGEKEKQSQTEVGWWELSAEDSELICSYHKMSIAQRKINSV